MKKEIPILFSTPMVRAILDGRKTMTRRIVKPQPKDCSSNHKAYEEAEWKNEPPKFISDKGENAWFCLYCGNGVNPDGSALKCPYGKPGDLLWVRETFI